MKHYYLYFFALSFIAYKATKTSVADSSNSTKRVFLFAGQSNMDGRANAADISTEDLRRLEKIEGRVGLHYNHLPYQPLGPVSAKKHIKEKFNLNDCFGPELFFGINLAENNPQDSFVLIKRAQGGTSLHGCWNPYWSLDQAMIMGESKQPRLYEDFVDYTNEVLAGYDNYTIEGLLWVQGETDSSTKKYGPVPADSYYTNLKNLLYETRRQLGISDLPMFIFQVGHGKVVEGMKHLASEDAQVYFIPQSSDTASAHYYQKNPPPIGHYTARGMKKMGYAFHKTYSKHN